MTADGRARGALWGLALGDALGMPTQSMSPAEIADDYGVVTGFVAAGPHQRIAAGMPAGSITDDTEQAVLVGRLLVEHHGRVPSLDLAQRLIAWEQDMQARGSLDLLGPSTKAAVTRLLQGIPIDEAGRGGTTNGAAMRIAPVGVATPIDDVAAFVGRVIDASAVTHNTSIGIAGAAAIGAAVSAGVAGADVRQAIDIALAAAREGERRGPWVAGGSIAGRAAWAVRLLEESPSAQHITVLRGIVGTSVAAQESVPAALALVAVSDAPWATLVTAANLGGDTDTIAAMAGAVLGAVHGMDAWPTDAVATVGVGDLDLDRLADELLALRHNMIHTTPSGRRHEETA